MRVSTNTLYETGLATMQQQTNNLMRTQQQISLGRRILTPADDPVAAAHTLEIAQSQSLNQQYMVNVGMASDTLTLEESVLGDLSRLLQDVRDITVNAGNPVLDASNRAMLANNLRTRYQELLALANSTDGNGQYLFSGYNGNTQPFSEAQPGSVNYLGDQGLRNIQVSQTRQIASSDAGSDVFQRIRQGNGIFVPSADPANRGGAIVDQGTVLDPSKWRAAGNSQNYSIRFAVSAGVTSYDLIDNGSGLSLLTGLAPGTAPLPRSYTSGGDIDFSQVGPPAFDLGVRVNIKGLPQDGDSVNLVASGQQDIFRTLENLAQAIATQSGTALTNSLVLDQRNLDNALENIQGVRASAGVRLKELDSILQGNESRALQYSQTLSRLQDLDYAKAISDLTQYQVNLEAAQKSFAKIAGLSLFSYL